MKEHYSLEVVIETTEKSLEVIEGAISYEPIPGVARSAMFYYVRQGRTYRVTIRHLDDVDCVGEPLFIHNGLHSKQELKEDHYLAAVNAIYDVARSLAAEDAGRLLPMKARHIWWIVVALLMIITTATIAAIQCRR